MADLPKLHLGCGRTILPGWINLDIQPLEGVDVVADLDACAAAPLPFADDSIGEFLASHVLEHLHHPLPFMQELHRIAAPGAKVVIKVPHGGHDEAHADQTHVRQYFLTSFAYFAQPTYAAADYGYRGDWQPTKITLLVDERACRDKTPEQVIFAVNTYRNTCLEIIAELEAIKPARPPVGVTLPMPTIVITPIRQVFPYGPA